MDETTSGRRRNFVAHMALELFTVFIGVTLAFAFDAYRQDRADAQRREQLEQALSADLTTFVAATDSFYVGPLKRGLSQFDSLRAAGKRPSPFFFRINGAERAPSDVWQAAMQSGAGALLDPDVVIKVANFYNELSGEGEKYVRYAAFTEQRIFPLLESDTTAFYDPKTGDLKPEFKGHMRQLKELIYDLEDQKKRAREVNKLLTGSTK